MKTEREASKWAADWISWTHTPAGGVDEFTVTHAQPHIGFLFGNLPCLPRCSSECLSQQLRYALPVSNGVFYFWFPLLFLPILSFSLPLTFIHHNNSFLAVCHGRLSLLVALMSPNAKALSFPAHSPVVNSSSHTFSKRAFFLFQITLALYPFFLSLCIADVLHLPPSSCPTVSISLVPCFWVTCRILHGSPWDVSVISRSLISKTSSWQRPWHAEEHRHKAQRQLMRPHTPTASNTRPLQHQVSSQISLARWTVGNHSSLITMGYSEHCKR